MEPAGLERPVAEPERLAVEPERPAEELEKLAEEKPAVELMNSVCKKKSGV